MKYNSLDRIPHHAWGRNIEKDGAIRLLWTGSAVEVCVRSTELWVEMESCCELDENWIDVEIEGVLIQHFMLPKGRSRICLFRNMDRELVKRVRIIRDTPAMPDDPANTLYLYGFAADGKFMEVPKADIHLEFIGDSLTSGEGLNGPPVQMAGNSGCFHACRTFAHLTSAMLGAEYRCISQSGWGVYVSWDGKREEAIPEIYEQIAGLIPDEECRQMYDFTSWHTDAVIVNLGTNDDFYSGVSDDECARAVQAFCRMIRRNNPDAYILWAYGMFFQGAAGFIQEGIASYQQETGDGQISFLLLDNTMPAEYGSRAHPGAKAHQRAAKRIAARLEEIFKTRHRTE